MAKLITRWAKVTTRFVGLHRYPDAPEDVEYLKHPHRHVFHVSVFVEQHHDNREVEYIRLKEWLDEILRTPLPLEFSCEQMATSIGHAVQDKYPGRGVMVEVTEDGENGALIELEA